MSPLHHTLAFCFISLLLGANAVTEPELRSLLEFRKGIRDEASNQRISWSATSSLTDPTTCPENWPGISCDPQTGSIVAINLDRLGLSGELKFSTLTGLTSLRNLTLSGNNFSGRLVPSLGAISSLQRLDLSDNGFYGPVPGRISDLWNLNHLNLSANRFSGGFPALGFRNLQQLRSLDLRGNELWGDVREILPELRNVEFVDLSSNRFHGGLASLSIDNVSSVSNTLRHLNLSHNALNGGFFAADSVASFKSLEVVDLENNQINGELPRFGSQPGLRILRLARNQLFGTVPGELLQSSIPLRELDLSQNGFTGSISEINSTTLTLLNLSSNGLSGDLPSSFKTCLVIDLSGNAFSGDVSVVGKWEATPEFLDLSSNTLSGALPNFTNTFSRLSVLSIRNNSVAGGLPSLWDDSGASSQFSVIDLSSNKFSGSIPQSFFAFASLRSLNLSMNSLEGPIPFRGSRASELMAISSDPQMELLDLSTNSLTGALPGDIGTMERIRVLNVANNKLSGELPSELNKLSDLEYLDLSNNDFNGQIPDKLPSGMARFNVSYNDLSGIIPESLRSYPHSSFYPGNSKLSLPGGTPPVGSSNGELAVHEKAGRHNHSRLSIKIAIIVASVGAALMVLFVLFVYHRTQLKDFHGRKNGATTRDAKFGRSTRPSFLNFTSNAEHHQSSSLSFSNDHLLTANSRSLSGIPGSEAEITEQCLPATTIPNLLDDYPAASGRKSSSGGGSPLSSPRFSDQPVMLDVYSPDRLAGELFFLDVSLKLTAEELSRAPAEVLGRSSHGTLYKATLDNGHMLTVKWLRVGLVRHKKDFAKEAKKIGSLKHPNIVPLRAYYWGPREQERLLLSDYLGGESLAMHLYETTPRRYSPMSFTQRLKVAVEVAQCLLYLHDRAMPHGNLKPTNIILTSPDNTVRITDYCIHRLMSSSGVAEQILNMSALGYSAPELASASKPVPTLKSDVYAFGVILMELLTRRSAGDIISGQSGAVDLTDWVRLCDQEGRRMDCIDRDIAGGEEFSKAMEDALAIAIRCIASVNERPNIRQVLDLLSSLSS